MSYLTATRYGLTHIDPRKELFETGEKLYQAGWRQVWQHPSGLLAMRNPWTGYWVVSDGYGIEDEGFSSSLRGAARRIEQRLASSSAPSPVSPRPVRGFLHAESHFRLPNHGRNEAEDRDADWLSRLLA
jgi:hypothetical protein